MSVVIVLLACNAQHTVASGPDLSVFATASSVDEVRAALPSPEALAATWTCGDVPEPLSLRAAGELWERCGLAALGPKARFAAAAGDRVGSARLHVWLKAQGAADAVRGPRLLLGEPPFEGELVLPEVPGASSAPSAPFVTVAQPLTAAGAWGRFPYWHVPGMTGAQGLALDASLPVSTLRRALASHAPDGRALPILVASDAGLATVPLAVPGDAPAALVTFTPGTPLALPAEGAIRVSVADDRTVGELLGALGPAVGRRIELAMDHQPCLSPPGPGLRCLPGDGTVGTFYVDEAADLDTAACKAAQVCRDAPGTWEAARQLCTFRGKRLPTRWEAERAGLAAKGEPTWTWTWAGDGGPPLGTCDGAPKCATSAERMLTDGTAKAPGTPVKAPPFCVTDQPWLTTWPPAVVASPPPPLPDPEPPTPEELAIAWGVTSDVLDDKGICGEDVRKNWKEDLRKGGRSTVECRDPNSYVTTNEPDRYLFERFLANAGGIYVGVGSDQSYDFIAEQHPRWAFVFDYDPNVVRFHQVLQPLLRAAETREAFVALWTPEKKDEAERLIGLAYPTDAEVIESFYHAFRNRLHENFHDNLTPSPKAPTFGFLATNENYAFVRLLATQKRIVPVGIDMLETVGMRSVGDASRRLGMPVRVYYTSNAPTAWGGQATPDYKANVRSLPMDDRSMVLATFNSGAWAQVGRWRYDIMHGLLQQERLGSDAYTDNKSPTWDRIPGDHGNLTVVRLPASFVTPAAP